MQKYDLSDVLLAVDKGQEAVVVLLDFSAIDHTTMTDRFQRYGIKGTVLKWLISYLCNRKQCIVVNGSLSNLFYYRGGSAGVCDGSVRVHLVH